jgi:hypothetical protein
MKVAAALLLLLALSPVERALQDGAFKHENTPDNLKQLFERLHRAITAGDDKSALALTNSVLPDEAALKKGLKDGVAPEAFAQALDVFTKQLPDESRRAKLFRADPANTEVRVYAATTEEIVKYEKGSTAFMHFPMGAKKLAETVLRPGMTYHEVVLAKPGADAGMKFHLFYWAGDRWAMLGPLWRAIK